MDVCIYHNNCVDGFAAALAVWLRFGNRCEYVPANYGDDPPNVRGKNVAVVDFSYKRPVMERLIDEAATIIVLDHHKTAKDELKGLPHVVFDMDKSGAVLAWEHFHPDSDLPDLYKYVQDRDLWKWELTNSREYSAYLATLDKKFVDWEYLVNDHFFAPVSAYGKWILKYQDQQVAAALEHDHLRIDLAGYDVPVINTTHLVSEIVGALAEGEPFAVGYFDTADRRVFSLRSRGDDGVDVSEIARRFGGGGHRNAAGFQIPRLPIGVR